MQLIKLFIGKNYALAYCLGGAKSVILFTDDGQMYGIYKFDKGGKLVQRHTFVDGKLDSIEEYDNNEQLKVVEFIDSRTKSRRSVEAGILKRI